MKLMIIILKDENLLEQVTSILVEAGFYDASVLDGENIETLADTTMPLLASFKNLFSDDFSYNRTIVCPAADPQMIKDALNIFEKEQIDFSNPQTGTLFTLPCTVFTGENREDL